MQMLRGATLTTPDLDAAIKRYSDQLEYRLVDTGRIAPELAASWGAPAAAERRYALLQPASGDSAFLRFVERDIQLNFRPLRTFGWAAIELCVRDTLAVNERLQRSAFRIIGPPRENVALPMIFPMQVEGPDGDVVFLTECRGDLPQYDLPRARSFVDRLFIVVLACSNIRESMRWFAHALGVAAGPEIEIPYSTLSAAFGLPATHRHVIATGQHERDCFLEFDQYPEQATSREGSSDMLKPGVALASFIHPDLDGIPSARWLAPPKSFEGPLYSGARAGTMCAPDGALVEVIEAR